MPAGFAATPEPPYYAAIFTSRRNAGDDDGYAAMAESMMALALRQPGCLGAETARDAAGLGITVSYWDTHASLLAWKQVAAHLLAQCLGKERWYAHYELRIAKVERAYGGPAGR